jgi:putative drug exporter of the RND superfamily
MSTFLYRLGAFAARRRRTVVLGWLFILGCIVVLGVLNSGTLQSSSSIPGSPAQTALTKMDLHYPNSDVQAAQVVFEAPAGHSFQDPAFSASLHSSLRAAAHVRGVTSVSDPSTDGMISRDGRTAAADVNFSTPSSGTVPGATLSAVKATGHAVQAQGGTVIYGGSAYSSSAGPIGATELIGIMVAFVLLIITFGALVAAGLPLLTAILGVAGTLAGILGLASVVGISQNALTLAAMLGLAVGIDYALFIVSRHRRQLATGMAIKASIATAIATAGTAVVFAGATVVIALAGLSVAGVPMLTSMGLATAGAVAMAVLLALTLLPALLAASGKRLIPKAGSRAARRATDLSEPTMGVRWVSMVTRHPVRTLVAVGLGLLVVAAPASQLKLAVPDNGSDPTTAATRQAYDRVSQAFGPGANGPLIVLVENNNRTALQNDAAAVVQDVQRLPGIAHISGVDVAKDGLAARVRITPTTGPRAQQTSDLVNGLRTATAPIAKSDGSYVAVTGLTAVSIDVSAKLGSALLPFGILVVGLSLLLLMVAFRSIAIPIKATVGFLLSLGSAFGATVAVFQWGWLSSVLGVPNQGPVASFTPIIVMSVLFGLAMDYEVFLVSAMREEYAASHDPQAAIAAGARGASRVVTAAGLIMIAVFVSFLLSKDPAIMPIAFALAFGVFVDAFLVRMTLVPAVLERLGHRAWHLPRRLDRFVPHIDVEGGGDFARLSETAGDATDDSGTRLVASGHVER